MATVYKNVSGVPAAAGVTSYNTLYSTSGSTTAVISTIAVCNQGAATATFRIAISSTGGTTAPTPEEFLVYDASVAPNDTIFITVGATLANSRNLKFSCSATTVSVTSFVSEIS
jgi:hypothetical protein